MTLAELQFPLLTLCGHSACSLSGSIPIAAMEHRHMKKALIYPLVLIAAGICLAIVFAVLSMSTGMWGCGSPCRSFIGAFWLAIGVVVYGIWLAIQNKRKGRYS